MHTKRTSMPKEWPVERKGSKYILVADHAKKSGVPVLFIIRNLLKLARTRKETKHILHEGYVKVNGKVRKSEGFPVKIFDIIEFDKLGKSYKLDIKNNKFILKEVSGKETERKTIKISGKKVIGKNKIQINLEDGHNFISKENCSVGDSVVISTKEGKIEKVLKLKEGAKLYVVSGKHSGEEGKLKEVDSKQKIKRFVVQLKDKTVELPLKTIMVTE